MTHTYATVADFRLLLTDNSSAVATTLDSAILSKLEGASRAVDRFVNRSSHGSGFGPRVATNYYDGDGSGELRLDDDFISISAVVTYSANVAVGTAVVTTDYYTDPYDQTPTRGLILHGSGSIGAFPSGRHTVSVAGTAGYQATTVTLGTCGTVGSGATSVVISSGTPYAGMTLLIGSEHLYVTATSGGTATVVRGQNGTTAAAIPDSSAVSYYTYPSAVKEATLAVAQRRWKNRDAGLTGEFGIPSITGTVEHRDSERSILAAHLGDLKVYGA